MLRRIWGRLMWRRRDRRIKRQGVRLLKGERLQAPVIRVLCPKGHVIKGACSEPWDLLVDLGSLRVTGFCQACDLWFDVYVKGGE